MNNSSLFSLDESSVWNLQVTKQVLCIPEDQLNILRAIPGWNEVKSISNTLRIEKDFPIENSQFQSSVYNSQNTRPVTQHNLDLFEKHQKERKNILEKKCQNYSEKLSRSVSLFYLDNTEETLLPDCSLYRVSSLPNLCESSEKELAIYSDTKSSSVINKKKLPASKQVESSAIFKAKEVTVSDPEKSVELFWPSKISTEVMEVEIHLPNISTHILKPAVQAINSEVVSEKNGSTAVLANEISPNSLKSDTVNVFQLSKNPVDLEKITQDKSTKLPEENSCLLAQGTVVNQDKPNSEPTNLASQVSSNITPIVEVAPEVSSDVPVNPVISVQKCVVDIQCLMANPDEKAKNEDSSIKNISEIPKSLTIPSDESESKNSDLHAVGEKSPVVDSETGTKDDHNSFNHELQNAIKKSVIPDAKKANGTGSVDTNKTQIDSLSKIDDGKNSAIEEFKSNDQEVAIKMEISGKRKLDSKNRRSKKLKSEDTKRGKTRSLKKVSEVYYDVEDIKTMLEIMKQYF